MSYLIVFVKYFSNKPNEPIYKWKEEKNQKITFYFTKEFIFILDPFRKIEDISETNRQDFKQLFASNVSTSYLVKKIIYFRKMMITTQLNNNNKINKKYI